MIRVRQIEVPALNDNIETIKEKCAYKLKIAISDINSIKINKKSIDARHKPDVNYSYEVDIDVNNEKGILRRNRSNDIILTPDEKYVFPQIGGKHFNNDIVIVGMGPSGLFCGYMLASMGYSVTLIDRGNMIEDRIKDVEEFWNTGILNTKSNVQFGEGGAGTFSDGKLNTLVKDSNNRHRKVLEIFVECGAPSEIIYVNKPHIGTDLLRQVIINMRNKMKEMGCKFLYNTCLTNLIVNDNKVTGIEVNNSNIINTDILVLALGHSARDTFRMLYEKKLVIKNKPFAVGIRIQHPQKMIDYSQYSRYDLDPASYKLTHKASNGHGVYTFCMCPGGYVVNASSQDKKLAINGMSNYKRDSANANSAVIVTVSHKDYGNGVFDGVYFQEKLEEAAYKLGSGKIPVQLYGDFKNNLDSKNFGDVQPIFMGDYCFKNIRTILPSFISNALIEGIDAFNKKINGFGRDDAIIAAIESRTSSPIRIERNDALESNISGIYPIGEGAGYAGGITSAAIDGIRCSEAIISIYSNK